MSDNPAIAAALANPAKPDGPVIEMAVVQTVHRPARTRTDQDGNDVMVRAAIPVGHVHQTVMLPAKTSFQPPANTALIPAEGLRAGDVAQSAQMAAVLGAAQGVKLSGVKTNANS